MFWFVGGGVAWRRKKKRLIVGAYSWQLTQCTVINSSPHPSPPPCHSYSRGLLSFILHISMFTYAKFTPHWTNFLRVGKFYRTLLPFIRNRLIFFPLFKGNWWTRLIFNFFLSILSSAHAHSAVANQREIYICVVVYLSSDQKSKTIIRSIIKKIITSYRYFANIGLPIFKFVFSSYPAFKTFEGFCYTFGQH